MQRYHIKLSEEAYMELAELRARLSTQRMLKPFIDSLKGYQKEIELSRVEYCFFILRLKQVRASKKLIEELKEMGRSVDEEFNQSFERIKSDVFKYDLLPG